MNDIIGSRLTVGVTTRDRPDDLLRCVRSLSALQQLVHEVVVVDDASREHAKNILATGLPAGYPIPVRVIRFDQPRGYIVARNLIAAKASTDFVFYLDDDTQLIDPNAVRSALVLAANDESVMAVAFAQADAAGRPWPPGMQPSPAIRPVQSPTYIGFAHLVNRKRFLQLDGYRECFEYYAEEKEFCLRALDTGYKIVYVPDLLVIHFTSQINRSSQKWLRYNTRNAILTAAFTMPIVLLPVRFLWYMIDYFRVRRASRISDPWGYLWVLKELVRLSPEVVRTRRPVKHSTLQRWQRLKTAPPAYPPGLLR